MLYTILVIIFLLIIFVWVVKTYNTFIMLDERVENGKAQISTQIESRWDAIKSLISATKKYSQHEGETLEKIVEKRISVGGNSSIHEIENNSDQLDKAIGRLLAITENYPELKASEVYQSTMESINKYENKVRDSRMIYNDTVTKYNRLVKSIPTNIIARMFNFKTKEYFQGTDVKQELPSWD